MTRVSHMALWLVAVILLIAVGAMPSGAQAHEGHRHPAGPSAVSHAAPIAQEAAAATRMSVPVRTGLASACDGLCCGPACHGGTSCCTGAGLAAEAGASAPPRRPGERALARALPARTDVVPEALPEPPRSFA